MFSFRSRVIGVFLALFFTSVSFGAQSATGDVPPDILVKSVTEEALVAIKASRTEHDAKRKAVALVEEKIAPHINFEHMTRLAVGVNWRQASKEEQETLVREFHVLLVRTYAAVLERYREQEIVFTPLRTPEGDTDALVRARILQSGGPSIAIDVRMEKLPSGWKVYDIAVDGISLVTNYRSSFKDEVSRGGIHGLINELIKKNGRVAKSMKR